MRRIVATLDDAFHGAGSQIRIGPVLDFQRLGPEVR